MEAARTLLEDIAQYLVGPADPRKQLHDVDKRPRDCGRRRHRGRT